MALSARARAGWHSLTACRVLLERLATRRCGVVRSNADFVHWLTLQYSDQELSSVS